MTEEELIAEIEDIIDGCAGINVWFGNDNKVLFRSRVRYFAVLRDKTGKFPIAAPRILLIKDGKEEVIGTDDFIKMLRQSGIEPDSWVNTTKKLYMHKRSREKALLEEKSELESLKLAILNCGYLQLVETQIEIQGIMIFLHISDQKHENLIIDGNKRVVTMKKLIDLLNYHNVSVSSFTETLKSCSANFLSLKKEIISSEQIELQSIAISEIITLFPVDETDPYEGISIFKTIFNKIRGTK